MYISIYALCIHTFFWHFKTILLWFKSFAKIIPLGFTLLETLTWYSWGIVKMEEMQRAKGEEFPCRLWAHHCLQISTCSPIRNSIYIFLHIFHLVCSYVSATTVNGIILHFVFQLFAAVKWSEVKVIQLCLTLCNPMNYRVQLIIEQLIIICIWLIPLLNSQHNIPLLN